jgi:hypothetical protein
VPKRAAKASMRRQTIDVWELRQVMEGESSSFRFDVVGLSPRRAAMGQSLTEEELFQLIAEVRSACWAPRVSWSDTAWCRWTRTCLEPLTSVSVLGCASCSSCERSGAGEFLRVIAKQKERASKFSDESDMIDAFVACGGEPDKSGSGA